MGRDQFGEKSQARTLDADIVVLGLGSTGCDTVSRIINCGIEGIRCIVVNTDKERLKRNEAPQKIHLVGTEEESISSIRQALTKAGMLLLIVEMDGSTGSRYAPLIARTARDMGILTVGVVACMKVEQEDISALQGSCDALLPIEDQKLFSETSFQFTQAIVNLLSEQGFISLDLNDVKAILSNAGRIVAGFGHGYGTGKDLMAQAARDALNSSFMQSSMKNMKSIKGVLISISTGYNTTLAEISHAAQIVRTAVNPEANIMWGHVVAEAGDNVRIALIMTGDFQ